MKEEHALLALSHQRRLVAAAAALLTTMPGCGGAHRKPKDFSWQDHVEDMTEAEFKLRYRLDSHSFYKLLERLEPELQKDEKQQLRARSGTPVATAVRLAVALRYFAGGDVLDLKLIYCMSKTAVMTCIWEGGRRHQPSHGIARVPHPRRDEATGVGARLFSGYSGGVLAWAGGCD